MENAKLHGTTSAALNWGSNHTRRCISLVAHLFVFHAGTHPHAKLNIFSTVDLHAWIQEADIPKVLSVHHKGAANHGRRARKIGRRQNSRNHKSKFHLKVYR